MSDKKNVSTGKPKVGGAISVAPAGSTLPKSASEALDKAFAALGYVSDAGVKNANSPTKENVKAWGGDIVMSLMTEKPDNFSFTLIEALNVEVLKFVYGDKNVSGDLDSGITLKANATVPDAKAMVIDMIMKGGILKRVVIPAAHITEVGEVTYNDKDPVGYATTILAEPDSDGNTHYEYIVKPAAG